MIRYAPTALPDTTPKAPPAMPSKTPITEIAETQPISIAAITPDQKPTAMSNKPTAEALELTGDTAPKIPKRRSASSAKKRAEKPRATTTEPGDTVPLLLNLEA